MASPDEADDEGPTTTTSAPAEVHDLIALGEIGAALSSSSSSRQLPRTVAASLADDEQIPPRLPLLLRLLSASRPLASVPSLPEFAGDYGDVVAAASDEKKKKQEEEAEGEKEAGPDDSSVDTLVSLLEAVAATHPPAETVDAVASYLAPDACRRRSRIGRLPPLRRRRGVAGRSAAGAGGGAGGDGGEDYGRSLTTVGWDADALEAAIAAAASGKSGPPERKRRKVEPAGAASASKAGGTEVAEKQEILGSDDEDGRYGYYDEDAMDVDGEVGGTPSPAGGPGMITPEQAASSRMLAELAPPSSGKRRKRDDDAFASIDADVSSSSFFARARSAAEDTLESTVSRTLWEMTSLVVSSLEPIRVDLGTSGVRRERLLMPSDREKGKGAGIDGTGGKDGDEEEEAEGEDGTGGSKSAGRAVDAPHSSSSCNVSLPVKSDSLLAEPSYAGGGGDDGDDDGGDGRSNGNAAAAGGGSGTGTGTELSATVAALMHNAPVLRHEHLANALCRASVPQAANLIGRLAANCPHAAPCLLVGCIDAYQAAKASSDARSKAKIMAAARASARAVADLSVREAWNVAAALNRSSAMRDLALEIAMDLDPAAATASMLDDLLLEMTMEECRWGGGDGGGGSSGGGDAAVSISSSSRSLRLLHMESRDDPDDDATAKKVTKKPARRRRIRSRRGVRTTFAALPRKPWLGLTLLESDTYSRIARTCVVRCLESVQKNDGPISWGEAAINVRAYSLLVHRVGIGAGSSAGSGSTFVESAMAAICSLSDRLAAIRQVEDCPRSSPQDRFRAMAICACIVTCSKFPPIAAAKQTFMRGPASSSCEKCLLSLLQPSISDVSDVFASRVAAFLSSEDATELRKLVISTLVDGAASPDEHTDNIESEANAFFNTCRWASSKIEPTDMASIVQRGMSSSAALVDVMAVVDAIRRGQMTEDELEILARDILDDPQKCETVFNERGLHVLLQRAVEVALSDHGTKMPLILPLRLEALAKTIPWLRSEVLSSKPSTIELRCQFVLQLFYAMVFLDQSPDSPFIIDPRSLPLTEALAFCEWHAKPTLSNGSVGETVHHQLKGLVRKHAPEAVLLKSQFESPTKMAVSPTFPQKVTLVMVANAIQSCLNEKNSRDAMGRRAEVLFLKARAEYPSPDVDTAATCALLSFRRFPPRAYSYSALCRDPLLLFKCHVGFWKCIGLRRIILSILQRLLGANDHVTQQYAQTEEAANQMLASRDSIVARCIIVAASRDFNFFDDLGNTKTIASRCPLTVSIIRSMIAKHRGLVTVMIKQGLPDHAVDWLVDHCPECLSDAPILSSCLSDRNNTLTAAERLTTADASLLIAISHGSRDEKLASQLAYAALTVLVSSFFLALGPVGVPVNVVHEEDGHDVTQTCRKATFRMLGAIQKISSERTSLKNEARMALGKMAGMCKSENALGGVSGTVAMRRKAVLKEIWDAILRSSNFLGGGMQF